MEILTVLAIVSIVTALGIPLYSHYVVDTRRAEAAESLSRLALAMEQYHISHHTYEGATLAALHMPDSTSGQSYQLAIRTAKAQEYLLVANPLGSQADKDKNCAALTLNTSGEKGLSGPGTISECW
jgi:type IV pilus assembly protein PilE